MLNQWPKPLLLEVKRLKGKDENKKEENEANETQHLLTLKGYHSEKVFVREYRYRSSGLLSSFYTLPTHSFHSFKPDVRTFQITYIYKRKHAFTEFSLVYREGFRPMSSTIVPCEVVEPVYGSSKIDMRIDSKSIPLRSFIRQSTCYPAPGAKR